MTPSAAVTQPLALRPHLRLDGVIDQFLDLLELAAVTVRPRCGPRQTTPPLFRALRVVQCRPFAAGCPVEQRYKRMIALAVDLLLSEPAWGRTAGFRVHGLGLARDCLPPAKQGLVPDIDSLVWAECW